MLVEGPLAEITVKISASFLSQNSIFVCSADFFHILMKSTIFSNKNNFCCFQATWSPKFVARNFWDWGPPHGSSRLLKWKTNFVFEGSFVEISSPSTIWGVECCRNFYFLKQQQKVPNFCEKNVFLSSLNKKLSARPIFGGKRELFFFSSLPIFEKSPKIFDFWGPCPRKFILENFQYFPWF